MRHFLCLILLAVALSPGSAAAEETSSLLSKKIQRAADTLIQEYRTKNPGKAKQPLAVFPLNAPGDLGKKRVGYAVSELLIPHFVKSAEFLVVERAALEKLLDEQRLHLTGLIDPDTAVKMGHLIGAKTVLLGSVEEIGGKYLVNARLVDADSGEVAAATHEEFSKWSF
ncbi:MAG: FlgO family outer membrane protein, partial [Elusimicrobiota bacterium]